MNFNDQKIIITGASSGLGKELAITLSKLGAKLVIAGRNQFALQQTANACRNQTAIITMDVSQESDCKKLIEFAHGELGKIDHLILNAGISMWTPFESLTDLSVVHKIMDTNFYGTVNCVFHALPYLKQNNSMITVISSIQGKIGVPYHSAYAASKHALQGFFDTLRIELKKDGIDILTVLPGWIRDTALKSNALGKVKPIDPAINKKHDQHGLSIESCVEQIIQAMYKRKRELIIPKLYRGVPWLKLLSPKLLDRLVRKNVD